MQRILALLMVVGLIAGVLMGCTPNEQLDNPTTNKTQPTTQNMVPDTNPTTLPPTEPPEPTDPTEPPEPPQEDFFTRHGQDAPIADQVPGYAQTTDTPNLYALNLELPGSDLLRQVLTYGNVLYLSYWQPFDQMPEGCGIRAYDLSTGSMLYDVECPEWSSFGPLADGGLWFMEYNTLTLHLLDATGASTTVSLGTGDEESTPYTYDACVDPSGQYLALLDDSGAPVVVHDLKTGTVTTPEFPENAYFYEVDYQQGKFLLHDYGSEIYLVDPATGECEQGIAAIEFDNIQDGIAYMSREESIVFAGIDGDPTCYFLGIEPGRWVSDLSHGCVALNSYDNGALVHVLDLRNQRYLADISFPMDYYTTFALFMDNGSLLILAASEEGSSLYFYDTSVTPAEAEYLDAYQCTQQELEDETARIAQDIFDATGVQILYGSQGNDFIVGDYVGVVELEPFKVFQAVSAVAEILWQYPEGMLREAWELYSDGLQIYLCGSLYGIGSGGLDQAGGVTSNVGSYIVVAIDINQQIDSVLYHEMSHVFDTRIGNMWEMDWFALWESIHPMSTPYTYSYDDYYNYYKYTPVGEGNPDKVWFVSSYGRTFPTEDRATILEILCLYTEEPPAELEYEHILYKARLYSYILRQCFPSCNGEEVPFWEQFLGTIDESILP